MGTTTAAPGDDDRKRRRRRKRSLRPDYRPGQSYTPTAFTSGAWWGYASSLIDGKPFFTYFDVPRMLRDPQVQFGLNMLCAPFGQAKWSVQSDSKEVSDFADRTLRKFWNSVVMRGLLIRYFSWGAGPALPEYEGEGGGTRVTGGRVIEPMDCHPRIWTAGEDKGRFAGFDLNGTVEDEDQYVPVPHAFWFGGNELKSRLYDTSRLAGAYEPWMEKNTRGGALQSRQLYYRTQAFDGGMIRFPVGKVDPTDAASMDNQDAARMIAEAKENGSIAIVPNTRFAGPNGSDGGPQWEWEPGKPGGAAVDLVAYVDALDVAIMKGLGFPPEVAEASETGSGWSGRMIPRDALFGMTDAVKDPLLAAIDIQILRELIPSNFGDGAKWEVEPIPLVESTKMQESNPTSAVMGGGPDDTALATAGDGVPDEQAVQAGGDEFDMTVEGGGGQEDQGGDPTAGGLVPYVGKRGGRGQKNPRTGEVYYMSHTAPHEYGCLLAPVTGPLRDAALKFAKSIPPGHLADDGAEDSPHVTIRYGLHESDPADVFGAVAPVGSLTYEPGPLRVFEGDDHDVLYVSCRSPERWGEYHRALKGVPHTDTHAEYTPHLTLAYLKSGKGAEYVGQELPGAESCPVGAIRYCTAGGEESDAPVWPSAGELVAALSGEELAWVSQWSDGNWGVKAVNTDTGRVVYGERARKILETQGKGKDVAGLDNVRQFVAGSQKKEWWQQSPGKQPPSASRPPGKSGGSGYKPLTLFDKAPPAQPKPQQPQPKAQPQPKSQPAQKALPMPSAARTQEVPDWYGEYRELQNRDDTGGGLTQPERDRLDELNGKLKGEVGATADQPKKLTKREQNNVNRQKAKANAEELVAYQRQLKNQMYRDLRAQRAGDAQPSGSPAPQPATPPVAQRLPSVPEAKRLPSDPAKQEVPKQHLEWAKGAASKHLAAAAQRAGLNPRMIEMPFQSGVQAAMRNLHRQMAAGGKDSIRHRVMLPGGKHVMVTIRRKQPKTEALSHVGAWEFTFTLGAA